MKLLAPELLSPAEMGKADEAAIAGGAPGIALMENAGRAVARAVMRRFAPCRTLVLCGPGNNGGDGYITARRLAEAGWPVALASLAAPRPGTDAALAAARWRGPCADFSPAASVRAELVIDAVFGAGLARPVEGLVADTLCAARLVAAIDVPSGLDGANGTVLGYAPSAALTVTFFRRKPGHVLLPGRLLCGALILAEIGIPPSVLETVHPRTFANGPALWRLPMPASDSHKWSRGHVTVLGGATMTGAARLAAAGARRIGAGMVTIAAPASAAPVYRVGAAGVIVSEAPLAELLQDARRQVFVCGPGLGVDAARIALPALLAAKRRIVVDADALTAFAGSIAGLRGAAVLTPHEGEFARLFGTVGPNRLEAAREAARRTGAVVVLKGADTVIAAPDGWAAVNDSAPPDLATAGTGDVLAGMIAGLLAQGLAPREAASAGVFLHGAAAEAVGPGLIAEDLPQALPRVIASMRAQS
ncbi:MAG TPA: NAD(P)H-hydrate dehydratase [Acetobacteraceae bacterium]|nr:NAD(P)H-hydrate dehydratase [Acetobacteraceae bacterium]